jgi:phosphotransferase system enzyme I (PtsI)
MDIPAVVGARGEPADSPDDWVVIDGDAGIVIVDPSGGTREYRLRQRQRDKSASGCRSSRHFGDHARRAEG